MKIKYYSLIAGLALSLASAQVFTNPVGYNVVECLGGSDTHVSVPFHQKPIYQGSASNSGATVTLSTALTTTLGTNILGEPTHYIRVTSGLDEGKYFNVTSASGATVSVDLNGDTLTLAASDTLKVIPHWTLDTLFPVAEQNAVGTVNPTGTFYLSPGQFVFQRASEILLPDRVNRDVNKPNPLTFYVTSAGWFNADATGAASGSTIIEPDGTLIVRHPNGQSNTNFISRGAVETGLTRNVILSSTSSQVDNPIGSERPIPVTLAELSSELTSPVFIPSTGTFSFQRADELLVVDNTIADDNKPAGKTYYTLSNGEWRDASDNSVADNVLLNPSEQIIIRKATSATGNTEEWVNSPTY